MVLLVSILGVILVVVIVVKASKIMGCRPVKRIEKRAGISKETV